MRLKICLDCSDYIIYLESNSAAIYFGSGDLTNMRSECWQDNLSIKRPVLVSLPLQEYSDN